MTTMTVGKDAVNYFSLNAGSAFKMCKDPLTVAADYLKYDAMYGDFDKRAQEFQDSMVERIPGSTYQHDYYESYDYIEQQNTLWNIQRCEVWRGGMVAESPESLHAHVVECNEVTYGYGSRVGSSGIRLRIAIHRPHTRFTMACANRLCR